MKAVCLVTRLKNCQVHFYILNYAATWMNWRHGTMLDTFRL